MPLRCPLHDYRFGGSCQFTAPDRVRPGRFALPRRLMAGRGSYAAASPLAGRLTQPFDMRAWIVSDKGRYPTGSCPRRQSEADHALVTIRPGIRISSASASGFVATARACVPQRMPWW